MIGFRLRVLFSIFVASSCVVQSIGFKWEQHLNPNGKAESIECSSVSGSDLFQGSILDKVESEFIDYPRFLARRKVLLGLFTAEKKFHGEADPTTRICDSLLGINLLTFGKTKTTRFTLKEKRVSGSCTVETRGVITRLPVVGGLLACRPKTNDASQSSVGTLTFQLTQSRSKSPEFKDNLHIETRILDYEPAIAGKPPVNFLRKTVYLHTQRYFHAYVMWRFHNHCYNILVPPYQSN